MCVLYDAESIAGWSVSMDKESEIQDRSGFIVSLVCLPLAVFGFRNWYWQLYDICPLYVLEVIVLALASGVIVYLLSVWFWSKKLDAHWYFTLYCRHLGKPGIIAFVVVLAVIGGHILFGTQARRECIFWESVHRNNLAMTAEMLGKGVSPNIKNKDGITPIAVAVSNGSIEIISLLVDHNADLNVRSEYSSSILDESLESGMNRITALLIQSGAKTEFGNQHLENLYAQYLERQQRYRHLQ